MKRSVLLLISMTLLVTAPALKAQDSTTADGLFQLARKAAFDEKNYDKARAYLHKGLAGSPNYNDLRTFLGRLHAWDKNYDSARYHFRIVLNNDPMNEDAGIAFSDVEYWNDNYSAALNIVNNALEGHPDSEELLLRKARILNAQRNYTDANTTLQKLLSINKSNTQARALAATVYENSAVNTIGITYDHLNFQKQFADPWHLVSFSYGRQTRIGSITGRVNYANRFRTNGLQYEIDAYPRISKTFYSYISAGYSNDVGVFPAWRAGFSLYANLPAAFEAEAGIRYLYFSDPTFIYTAYLGKYHKNFLFGFRTYLTPSNDNISQSYNASMRYYFGGGSVDFFGLTIGTGISPDERSLITQLNANYKLRNYKVAAQLRKALNAFNIISLDLGWNNQEYQPGKIDNQLQAGIGYQLRFK